MDEKVMQFANFNITFGQENSPMLEYFEDIVFPAFTGGYIRGKEDDKTKYSFDGVAIKQIDSEYMMVGNFVKDTEYNVITTVQEGELISSPARVPTAPYSRFIIFLKNHRMVLIRNEPASPDIRSFQKTVSEILMKHIRKENKTREANRKLPVAIAHIVDIPRAETIEQALSNIKKVNWLKFRFFPLNNDLDTLPLARAVREGMQVAGSRTGNIKFNSPENSKGIQDVIVATGGLAEVSLEVTDMDGEVRRIKEGSFSSNTKIEYNGNVSANGDPYLVQQAKKNKAMNTVSDDNAKLYELVLDVLKRFVQQ